MSANERQVGGDHYRRDYQHWDLMADLETPYLPGVLTKYVERHPKKAGRLDLEKAVHYAEKWLETGNSSQAQELYNKLLASIASVGRSSQMRSAKIRHADADRVFDYCLRAELDTTQTIIFHAALVLCDPARTLKLCLQYLEKSYPPKTGGEGPEAIVPRRRGERMHGELSVEEVMKRDLTSDPGSPEDGGHHEGRSASPFAPEGFSGRSVPKA